MGSPSRRDEQDALSHRRYVGELFRNIVPRYDLMNTLMTGGMHHRWRRAAVRKATQGLEGVALDVAAGTGDLTLALADAPGISHVVGLDLVSQMLDTARSKAARRGRGDLCSFMVGDALSLPYPDDTFVCATTAWGLRNMPDLDGCLGEMVRVVKPGGMVVSLESFPVRKGAMKLVVPLLFHRLVPLLGHLVAGQREAYTYLPKSVEGFLTVEEMACRFEEAGLMDVGYVRRGFGAVALHWGTAP